MKLRASASNARQWLVASRLHCEIVEGVKLRVISNTQFPAHIDLLYSAAVMMEANAAERGYIPPTESFNERVARFKHAEPLTRKSSRIAGSGTTLLTPRSTPSPFKREGSPGPTARKRVKIEDESSSPSTPSRRRTLTTPRTPQTPGTTKRRSPNGRGTGYAPPSMYAHLSPIPDVLQPNLLVVFVGLNPGISTAKAGHAYSHPSNRFWHLLHISGLTPERKLSPHEDRDLPHLYSYGHTNIVSRPTPDQGGLSKQELVAGTADLEAKFRKWKPEVLCIAGKGIWEAIWKYKHGTALSKEEFKWGWQDESENMGCTDTLELDDKGRQWGGARVFVTTSPSGQAASVPWADKVRIWTELGDWVKDRRQQISEASEENVKIEEIEEEPAN